MQNRTSGDLTTYLDYPDLIEVKVEDDYYLKTTFNNGESKLVDIKPWLTRPQFYPLKDKSLFEKAQAEFGGVIWNEDIDIAQEALYDHGKPI